MRYVHKFGGSSLLDSKCYYRVINIIKKYTNPGDIIVVSASGNTTNILIDWVQAKKNKKADLAQAHKSNLYTYQKDLITKMLSKTMSFLLIKKLLQDLKKIECLLKHDITDIIYAETIGHGEIWSARLMSAILNEKKISSNFLDSRKFLYAEYAIQPKINIEKSLSFFKILIEKYLLQRVVITGFICRNNAGNTVLLGRNGSDYSATQIGVLAQADCVTLWSDVAGIYTADPRKVKNSFLIPLLTLNEANELARLGAPVLHTRTLQPISDSTTNLKLRCSYNPKSGETYIKKIQSYKSQVRIITSHENICIISFQSNDYKEFKSVYEEIIDFIKTQNVLPLAKKINIKQKLIQFFYTLEVAESVLAILKNFILYGDLKIYYGFILIAIVGTNVNFHQLHNYYFQKIIKKFEVEFFHQSENCMSILAILRTKNSKNIVKKLHKILFFKKKRIGLILFGIGNIGSHWLELFAREYMSVMLTSQYECILSGIINSRKSLLSYNGLKLKNILSDFKKDATDYDREKLLQWIDQHPFDHLVAVDITSSESLAKQYATFAEKKIHVISANKIAGSSSPKIYYKIKNSFAKNNCYWLYNATVGAGLPINYIIKDLYNSGDEILSISGVFSGTLSWLFSNFDGKKKFTTLVQTAWEHGLTEPDPRTDLSGQDVMRKLVILIREAGYNIDPASIIVESLVSEDCKDISIHDFFKKNKKINDYIHNRFQTANKKELILRYIANFDIKNNTIHIGIQEITKNNILASLLPGDNIFFIQSVWYKNPLIIRGPGAGRDVTAGAIQSDINRLIKLL